MTTEAQTAKREEMLNEAARLAEEAIYDAGEAGATEAQDKIANVLRMLLKVGAASPFGGSRVKPEADLSQLAALDTPEARRLLDLLTEAQMVAERVDAQRGRALPPDLPLQPGESRGTDLAEAISLLALRVRTEVHGPAGRE